MSDAASEPAEPMTFREYAERYAGVRFTGDETSTLWDKPVPASWAEHAAEGRRLGFRVIDGGLAEGRTE